MQLEMRLRGVALLLLHLLLMLRWLVWVKVDLLRFVSSRMRIVLAVMRGLRVSCHVRGEVDDLSRGGDDGKVTFWSVSMSARLSWQWTSTNSGGVRVRCCCETTTQDVSLSLSSYFSMFRLSPVLASTSFSCNCFSSGFPSTRTSTLDSFLVNGTSSREAWAKR